MFETIDRILNFLTRPELLFPGAGVLLWLSLKYAHVWTRPKIAGAIGAFLALLVVYACLPVGIQAGHAQFRESISRRTTSRSS